MTDRRSPWSRWPAAFGPVLVTWAAAGYQGRAVDTNPPSNSPALGRHRIEVCPVVGDIDELEHVSNQVYLRWILQAALSHSDALGWGTAEYRRLGGVWVVRRHEIDYARATLLGEALEVSTWVDSWKRASCVRKTELARVADAQVVCRAATTWAFVSFAQGRPTKIPEALRAAFEVTTS